jgi:CRISPR/Cas system CMR subunit Cmr6 (Cas7 group RAMP superfamily)
MPILMPTDTRAALGDGAQRCDSRHLLLEGLPFFDDRVKDYKRVALDGLLPDGKRDLDTLRTAHRQTVQKQENIRGQPRFNQRKLDESQGFLDATASLAQRQRPTTAIPVDPLRWLDAVPAARKRSFTLLTADRLAIGLANGVLENCGLTLHRFFGHPKIPGSALKGIAADAAREIPEVSAEADTLFATAEPGKEPERQGAIAFLDAYPVAPNARLEFDVATPHYRTYYAGTGNSNATDTENPIPIVFPVVAKGVTFRFALICLSPRCSDLEAERLLGLAEQAVRHALGTRGIGAKTASGYGWFVEAGEQLTTPILQPNPAESSNAAIPAEHPAIIEWRGKGHDQGNFRVMLPKLAAITDTAALEAALPSIVGDQSWKRFRRSDPYWQAFASNPHGKAILDRLTRKLT